MRKIKTKITALMLAVVTLFLVSVPVYAAKEEEYLSEVALVYEDTVEDAKAAIAGTDWKLLEIDLNKDADYSIDDGVYLIYKTSTNVEDAITDLRVMDMYGGYSSSKYEEQLHESRVEYLNAVSHIREAADEFKKLYEAGDEMAKLAYRQMNYYQDVMTKGGDETGKKMGDFFLDLPANMQIVQVLFEGNSAIVSNLISLLAVGISGEEEKDTLSARVAEFYAVKDTLTDEEYYDDAADLSAELSKIRAKILRYDALTAEYNLNDDEMSEEEFSFLSEYASLAMLVNEFNIGDTTLADMIRANEYSMKDLYPLVAALTDGQMALIQIGRLETVLKYNSPTKPIAELNAILDELEATELMDENGVITPYDVYLGVDRSIFEGTFAMTDAAERKQSITGETWDWGDAASRSKGEKIGYIAATAVDVGLVGFAAGLQIKYKLMLNYARTFGEKKAAASAFAEKWAPVSKISYGTAIALALIIVGCYGITTIYNYYNPDYTEIPNTMVDVRETDLGDKYIKYTAAKVFEEGKLSEKKNADFNAYQGREWNALYYTKDATAGKCLLPTFVVKNDTATVARRHQGISMFGETEAYNLNSHVYDDDALGVYVTVRYSTAKKAAEDVPTVVGSMLMTGALYALTALGGAGVGAGVTAYIKSSKRKKEDDSEDNLENEAPEAENSPESEN